MPARFECGSEISAFSVSPDHKAIAVVGRSYMRILDVATDTSGEKPVYSITASMNLRAEKKFLSGCDIQWHPNPQFSQYFASGATNGTVVIWNLQAKKHRVQESSFLHPRAVNRVAWSMLEPNLLMSGCQDGIARLFDLRVATVKGPQDAATLMQPQSQFASKADSVRDVQFSPKFINFFATVHDNGRLQVWDMRNTGSPRIDFPAHTQLTLAVDWHPDNSQAIVTSSRDQSVRVWDLTTKPKQTAVVYTSDSVGRVRWRPSHQHQLATSASVLDANVHVWDVRNVYVPLYSLGRAGSVHHNIVSCVEWFNGPDALVSSSKDVKGDIQITHISEFVQPHRSFYPSQAITFSASSDVHSIAFCLDTVARGDTEKDIQSRISKKSAVICTASMSNSDTVEFRNLAHAYHGMRGGYTVKNCLNVCTDLGLHAHAYLWESILVLERTDRQWEMLSSIFDYHSSMNDIHTCGLLLLIYKSSVDKITSQQRGADCHLSYVDILRRMQLFDCAASVTKYSPFEVVSSESKQATNVRTVSSEGAANDPQAACAVCRLPVRGIVAWCRKCGRSGHIQHMRDCRCCSAKT
eukprot:ANDGO_00156.mRNA.1 WD repeat-containing protein 24 homolog